MASGLPQYGWIDESDGVDGVHSNPDPEAHLGLITRRASTASGGRSSGLLPLDEDLEQALLPEGSGEEQEVEGENEDYVEHVMESSPKRWPQLRLSSVSTRRLSPAFLTGSGDGGLEDLLPPRPGSSGFATPSFAPTMRAAPSPSVASMPRPPRPSSSLPSSDQQPQQQEVRTPPAQPQAGPLTRAGVTGAINSVLALPIMGAFASIIFRDPFFKPMLGDLVKLVFLSSAVHQMVFALFSSLPFAVGQVQDVGLIFLSAIASAVVAQCNEADWSTADTLATVLVSLLLATGTVGILIIATGTLKLASLVQYVPLPVVGGYLSFVGYFCLAAGVSLATGLEIDGPVSWLQLADTDALLKLAPAVAMVLVINLVMRRFKSPLALPALLLLVPTLFYFVLYASRLTLEDAQEAGWVSKPQPGDGQWRFWHAWGLYNIHDFPPSNIYWHALPSQVGKLLALYFVVAFGSSMDIAAIQAEAPRDLDYNAELVTVGLSNLVVAGAGCGCTGSYIFSQTLFSMRMGVDTPLMGAIVAAAELAVFAVPFNVMAFLPNFYFGGLTAWIGQDILKDWLFIAAKRISAVEYALLLATFALVMATGLEAGIVAGIVLAALHFAYSYSRVTMTAFTVVPSRSGAVRTFDQRTVLDMFAARITAVSLSGYLFFGSSVQVVNKVVEIADSTLHTQPHLEPAEGQALAPKPTALDGEQQMGRLVSLPSSATLSRTYDNVDMLADKLAGCGGAALTRVVAALAESPRFLILDFRRVQGLDATAARSFVTLHNKLQRMGIQLIITHITPRNAHVRQLLAAQGLILCQPTAAADAQADSGPLCLWFPTMDAGCQYCEERFLEVAVAHGLCAPQAPSVSLTQVLQAHLELPRCILGRAEVDYHAAAAKLARFTRKQELRAGDVLFSLGSPADDLYVIERGSVTCQVDFMQSTVHSRAQMPVLPADMQPHTSERRFTYGPGSIVGELDFFLQRPRSFAAVVDADGSTWRITRHAFEAMAVQDPGSLVLLQTIILRSTCLSANHAMEALQRSSSAD